MVWTPDSFFVPLKGNQAERLSEASAFPTSRRSPGIRMSPMTPLSPSRPSASARQRTPVAHLGKKGFGLRPHVGHTLVSRFGIDSERRPRYGDKRDAVYKGRAPVRDAFRNGGDVEIVDFRYDHRVHLYGQAERLEAADARLLPFEKQACAFFAGQRAVRALYSAVYPLPDGGIDRVHGDGHMPDADIRDFFCGLGQGKTVT